VKSVSGRDFARIVERRGWTLLRISGSHHIYGKSGSVVRLSIPIHGNKPLKTGLLRHLAKLAEISDDDLFALAKKYAVSGVQP
jgi:predicted RNA binding protein YcfA (HicA-like mRNA interferase family)